MLLFSVIGVLSDVSPEGVASGFVGIIAGVIALLKMYFEHRSAKKLRAMEDVKPSRGMDDDISDDPEVTRRIQNLEQATLVRMEWSLTEARDDVRRLQEELADLRRDYAATSQELLTSRYALELAKSRIEDLQRDLMTAEKRCEAIAKELDEDRRRQASGVHVRRG